MNADERDLSGTDAHHLSSTATCYSSLEDCPRRVKVEQPAKALLAKGKDFTKAALAKKDWKSDGSADIYCRCRTLPFVVSHAQAWDDAIGDHLRVIFKQWNDEDRPAIGEADPGNPDRTKWYPTNAYHTFWTTESIDTIRQHFPAKYESLKRELGLDKKRARMQSWAYQRLLREISLHSARSGALDSDQLAWSLALVTRDPTCYQTKLSEQDLMRHAFDCLFSTQEPTGTWRHYAPLFHYRDSGNAYCYIFETFSWLLKQCFRPGADFIRALLKKHFSHLVNLWKYAVGTTTTVEENRSVVWSSGHRVNKADPESWATASVFAYAHALRRLVGLWARDAALKSLNWRTISPSAEDARKKVSKFSKTWSRSNVETSELLCSMFIHPIPETAPDDRLEPDDQPIEENRPRSAILFGPPGTGKTSIVRAIAASIGWDYVELRPSHFVAEGLPKVQQTADVIFSRLMELDHTVVLFDEVDELVRERDIEPDQFGRFLTTSMLPRLAELWKAQKIMYFVATNHIEYFDRAVTRSQRFDAILYIGPPSFETKKKELVSLLLRDYKLAVEFEAALTREKIEASLPQADIAAIENAPGKQEQDWLKAQPLSDGPALSKFALLRYDELAELASEIAPKLHRTKVITSEILEDALKRVKDSKSRTLGEYYRFASDTKYERYDMSKTAAWLVEVEEGLSIASLPDTVKKCGKHHVVSVPVGSKPTIEIPGVTTEFLPEARVRLRGLPKAPG